MEVKGFCSDLEAGNKECSVLEDSFETEEALSLSDLPLYSSESARWEDFTKQDEHSWPSDQNDDDDFFEFLSEDFTTSAYARSENVIFCGKIIPFKGQKLEGHPERDDSKTVKSCNSMNREYSMGEASLGRSRSSAKSRWYPFKFGMSSLSRETDLKEIRSRQIQRSSPATEQGIVGKNKRRRSGKGYWKTLKSLLGFECMHRKL